VMRHRAADLTVDNVDSVVIASALPLRYENNG
jgi:hypothetical protein